MTSRITPASARAALKFRLRKNPSLNKGSNTIFEFAADSVPTDTELDIKAGLTLISNTAQRVVEAVGAVIEGTRTGAESGDHGFRNQVEQFNTLFFLLCTRAYLQAVSQNLVEQLAAPGNEKRTVLEKSVRVGALEDLKDRIRAIEDAELNYLFGTTPLQHDVPLFKAYDEWLAAALVTYGIPRYYAKGVADKCNKAARSIVRNQLAGDDPDAKWLRNFLVLDAHQQVVSVAQEVNSIRRALDDWIDAGKAPVKDRRAAWQEYRRVLRSLPDAAETMFSETFGVSSVFQWPAVRYHISGLPGDAGTPREIEAVAGLLGALVSNRTRGSNSLVILAGGPGSGKSTLCRVLASQLADVDEMYPVFLRLRRAREGEDISQFVEEQLRRLGLIDKSADIVRLPNLVLILDGFDELVSASSTRLRQFFNVLLEDTSTGVLRNATVIVSGRDTLFPQGRGLPTGSHVLSLLPFNRERVASWGKMWRAHHSTGPGRLFRPERLLAEANTSGSNKPLHHLVTWPLTLHLVARIFTAGHLRLDTGSDDIDVEKAYLYRSILAQTATRQVEQTAGEGRFDPEGMRKFLRALAWEMYQRSVDSMDIADVGPILAKFNLTSGEADTGILAEIAVVNAPELTRGEETGFEFVHKSFAEFLAAEVIAEHIERSSFKVTEFGSTELAWRMSIEESTSSLAFTLGARVIPPEVQEMLEPMLGGLLEFQRGTMVDDRVDNTIRSNGLSRTIERLECLYEVALNGHALTFVSGATRDMAIVNSPLEAYSNYCVGLVLVGSAAARQFINLDSEIPRQFRAEPFDGAFWRFLSIVQAGGLVPDEVLAHRLFRGLTVRSAEGKVIRDVDVPLKLRFLGWVDGFDRIAGQGIPDAMIRSTVLPLLALVLLAVSTRSSGYNPGLMMGEPAASPDIRSFVLEVARELRYVRTFSSGLNDVARLGVIDPWVVNEFERMEYGLHELIQVSIDGSARLSMGFESLIRDVEHIVRNNSLNLSDSESIVRMIDALYARMRAFDGR